MFRLQTDVQTPCIIFLRALRLMAQPIYIYSVSIQILCSDFRQMIRHSAFIFFRVKVNCATLPMSRSPLRALCAYHVRRGWGHYWGRCAPTMPDEAADTAGHAVRLPCQTKLRTLLGTLRAYHVRRSWGHCWARCAPTMSDEAEDTAGHAARASMWGEAEVTAAGAAHLLCETRPAEDTVVGAARLPCEARPRDTAVDAVQLPYEARQRSVI